MSNPKLSIIITAKDINDPKLKDLQYSLTQQTFQDFETIIVTEGDSESAKAIGIKKAKGEIILMLASDNFLDDKHFIEYNLACFRNTTIAVYPIWYSHHKEDNALNRYFALMGVNDPIPFYLKRTDKIPHFG